MLIKVCGMRDAGNITKVESLGVDMIGLIFYSGSSRYVACPPSYLPEKAKRVGVFVNETEEVILALTDKFSLNFIQLHGTESPDYCVSLRNKGLNLIKVFSVATPDDLKATEKEIKRNFAMGGHKAYYLLKALQNHPVILVSSMPDYYASNVFRLKTARAVNDALTEAFKIAGSASRVWTSS